MKSHPCQYPGCNKSFTRADHLRRHAFNHEQPKNGYTCERCSLHFHRPDLLRRHMTRHAKRDEEAGGPGLGVLETRKRTRRADDGSIVTRPIKRRTTRMSRETAHFPIGDPVTPDGSASDQPSQTGPLLAPMMPGPFEPYVEPVPGQFGADGSLRPLELDTATDFNMPLPFAATHDYNWLCDVAALRDAFNQLELELPLAPDGMTFAGLHTSGLDLVDVDERLLGQDALSVLQGGKYETRGLGVATAQQLAVRWGMVQDAMKVLVGLV